MCDSVLGNKYNTIPQAGKKIILTPSLFMRLLEWAKEDAKDDIALHQVFEKIMAFTDGTNPVGIECYDALIKDATGSSLPPESDEEDLANAEAMGKECANCGADLSNVDYSDAGKIIMQDKGNGYGASNAELENFWKGYETSYDLPLENGETQVNGELCDRLENAVASYHEGGISGNDCYDCIQQAFADNVQCPEQQICCDDIECVSPSFCQNITPAVDGMTITIDCEDGSCCDGTECIEQPCATEYDDQIAKIIKLGQF